MEETNLVLSEEQVKTRAAIDELSFRQTEVEDVIAQSNENFINKQSGLQLQAQIRLLEKEIGVLTDSIGQKKY